MTTVSERTTTTRRTLTVEGLTVNYGGVCAVRDLSFSVPAGEAIGVIGANGAGKTSTLKAVMGLVPRQVGTLTFGDADLSRVAARMMVRHGIGYVPEGRHVFAGLSVEKNLLLGAYARKWNAETRATLAEVWELFPVLGEMRDRLAGALSGGQQQMLAIGRMLAGRPRVAMLDEPTNGLAPRMVGRVIEIVRSLCELGLAVLLVEQRLEVAQATAQEVRILRQGRIVEAMAADDPELAGRAHAAYLGA
jgi:branched-chain amino acid transport system ATP-binding protein